ncbi:MFS transporter (macronuclear) [Tetrahymena thermophila SB210]|uniref:Lysosomal dipeptide transporter MFSD1 n=1 Tax=Tetrahymena thermophila (strain SB210) TaxID=312017 RepID=Q22SA7_TETTS|nr:MFS transporter [Tetrahymena thermophila SB210]EAR87865.1 MFS transporter [Tetrahymena thermophila SB210]|eukprot:XP_001008110.1 MFS transporter [Tetrahymena thermophila SB210]
MNQNKVKQDFNTQIEQKTNFPMAIWICLATFGSIYAQTEAPSLHDYWKEYYAHDYAERFEFYFNLSQSISLFSLVFLSFAVGILCDLYSNAIIMIVQGFIIVLGQFLVYCSYYFSQFWFFFVGRMLIILGMQTIQTSSKSFLNQHVADKEKGFLFGIHSSSVLVGKFVVLIIEPYIASKLGMEVALLFTFGLTCFSLFASYMTYYLEEKEKTNLAEVQTDLDSESQIDSNQDLVQTQTQNTFMSQWQQILSYSMQYWLFGYIIASSLLVTNVLDALLPAYLSSHWKINTLDATRISSIQQFYGFINWLMGMCYDWLQMGQEWLLFSSVASLVGQVILTQYDPVLGTVIEGLGYNMRVVAMFPLLGKLVKKEATGKAYGLIRSFKDLISMMAFLIIGLLVNASNSYHSSFQGVGFYIAFYTLINIFLYIKSKQPLQILQKL